jgi:hypothetical protein
MVLTRTIIAIYATRNRKPSSTSSHHVPSPDKSGGTSSRCWEQTRLRSEEGTLVDWWDRWRDRWHGKKKKGADSLFAVVAWEIWKERNARCFRNEATTVHQLLRTIKHTTVEWIEAGARKLSCLVRE